MQAVPTTDIFLRFSLLNSNRFIQELQTRFRNNTSEKEVYTWSDACYNEMIRDTLATNPIDHVRLEHVQYSRQNNLSRIVVELFQLRRYNEPRYFLPCLRIAFSLELGLFNCGFQHVTRLPTPISDLASKIFWTYRITSE